MAVVSYSNPTAGKYVIANGNTVYSCDMHIIAKMTSISNVNFRGESIVFILIPCCQNHLFAEIRSFADRNVFRSMNIVDRISKSAESMIYEIGSSR